MSRTGVVAKILNIFNQEINPATEEKQNDLITAIQNITIPTPAGGATLAKQDDIIEEISNKDVMVAVKTLLQAIAYPPYIDRTANQLRAQVTGSVTATVSSTTAAISTVDSYQGKLLMTSTNIDAWANTCRRLIS